MMNPTLKLRARTVKANLANRRCYALGFDETTGLIHWICKQGHKFSNRIKNWERTVAFLKRVTKQPDGYWTERGGGASTLCPKCWDEKRKELGI